MSPTFHTSISLCKLQGAKNNAQPSRGVHLERLGGFGYSVHSPDVATSGVWRYDPIGFGVRESKFIIEGVFCLFSGEVVCVPCDMRPGIGGKCHLVDAFAATSVAASGLFSGLLFSSFRLDFLFTDRNTYLSYSMIRMVNGVLLFPVLLSLHSYC